MKKAELDLIPAVDLLDLPDDTEIEDFDKQNWRGVWFLAVEGWWADGIYEVMRDGFKGFLERSNFDIYCDLRLTFISEGDYTWDTLAAENHEIGKYS